VHGSSEIPFEAVAFSPDNQYVLFGSEDGTVRIWETATARRIHQLRRHQRKIYAVAFSPDSKSAVTAGVDPSARFWDVASGKELSLISGGATHAVAFSPNGKMVLTGGVRCVLWDATTKELLAEFPAYQSTARTVAF